MSGLGKFMRRERLYILLLIFVALMAAATAGPDKKDGDAERPAAAAKRPDAADDLQKRQEIEDKLAGNAPLATVLGLATMLIFLIILLGVALDVILLSRRLRGEEPDIRTYMPSRPSWNLWDVVKVVVLFMFFGYMIVLIESALVRTFPVINNDNFRMVVNSALLDLLMVVFIVYFTAGQYGEKLEQLGLTAANFSRNVFYGLVGYAATVPVLVAVLALTAYVTNLINYVPEKQAVVELFLKEKDAAFLFFTSLFAAVAGPVIEELFFRGFMYNAVKKYAGIFAATLITASLFALVHAHAAGFVPILVLGVALAYLYEKTGSLVSSMTLHAVHNLSMVSLVFLVKQFGA